MKKIRRVIAWMLLLIFFFGGVFPQSVMAQDINEEVVVNNEVDGVEQQEQINDSDYNAEGNLDQEESDSNNSIDGTIETKDSSAEETQNDNSQDTTVENNQITLNYFYVDYPYLEAPGTQNIVISLTGENQNIENVVVNFFLYSDNSILSMNCQEHVDGAYRFEHMFTENESGVYAAENIT